ncbi:hypothetical protein L0337_09245 [candidate division KSB1 bacterium]|nr:hypothetical protein [candidate division KSB1 bacterium]
MNHSNPAPAVSQNTPRPLWRAPHALTITRRKLKPGQAGTRKLLAAYGEKLVCVRYRYDAANKRRMKTVELVIEESPWQPRPAKIPPNEIMHLRIKYDEVALRNLVKAAGGKWNREKPAWELPYQQVLRLGLVERIVTDHKKPQTARGYHETA